MPRTATSISRPVMASSMRTHSSYSNALANALSASCRVLTLLTPIDEPMLAGLTNIGKPNSLMARSIAEFASSVSLTVKNFCWAMPFADMICLATDLSIATALAKTPEPTYATCASSSKPCTVPSSPIGPCNNGITTSDSVSEVFSKAKFELVVDPVALSALTLCDCGNSD